MPMATIGWPDEAGSPAVGSETRVSKLARSATPRDRLVETCLRYRARLNAYGARVAPFVRYRSSSSGRSARTHGSFEWPAGARLTTRRTHAVKLRARGRLLLRRLESKGGRIPWPVRSGPSSSSGGASVTVVGRRCSPIGVQKRRLGVDLDGGCSRNPLGERQRDQRGRSGCRRSSDPGELEQRLGLGRA